MRFLKLHYKSGEPLWINADYIAAIERSRKGATAVYFTADRMEMWLTVKESPERIVELIRQSEQK